MLVLSRKLEQKIIIGEGENRIEITVTDIGRTYCRLGVVAPRHMPIVRGELLDKEKKDAGTA